MSQEPKNTVQNYYSHCTAERAMWEEEAPEKRDAQCSVCKAMVAPFHTEPLATLAEAWADTYKPIPNHLNPGMRASINGGEMFEPFDEDFKFIQTAPHDTVWTLVESDGISSIIPGRHHVNRMGYFVTRIPYDLQAPPGGFLWSIDPPEPEEY